MIWPTSEDVERDLKQVALAVESECDVRLQVYPDGTWYVRWGLADYDQDHHGFWGASSVGPGDTDADLRNVAEILLDEAKDDAAANGVEVDE